MTTSLLCLRSLVRRPRRAPRSIRFRPTIDTLEDRCLLSGNVLQTNLVSDLPGVAQVMDPNLVNPWGISESTGSPFWISDNNAGLATLYSTSTTAGAPPIAINPLAVNIPTPGNPPGLTGGTPTGTVFNIDVAGQGFKITDGTHTAPALFLFATEDGTIVGWNPGVDPSGKFAGPGGVSAQAVIAVDNSATPSAANGAVYKGLTIATDANGRTLLYAANFRSGKIDVFDTSFKAVTTLPAGAFTDANLPAGYAPFDIQELGGKIYATYALQDAAKHDDVAGPGHGFVDVFNLDGSPGLAGGKVRLVSRGSLDSPWGLALAPSSFGSLAGALLVGNFGNGNINAFNATTGASLGALKDPDGEPIQIDGLWALKVGNDGSGGSSSNVYFTAGLDHESHGLFGSLTPVVQGSPEGPAEEQAVQAAVDVFQLNLATVQKDISSGVTGATLRQAIQDLDASLLDLVRADLQFVLDVHADQGHHTASVKASAHDLQALDTIFADLGSLLKELR